MGRQDVLRLLSRWRIDVATVVVVPALLIARPTQAVILDYLPILFLGIALRTWARGHLDRGQLTTSGPYRYVRHPLYIGSFIMGLALALMMRRPVLVVLYLLFFVVMYWPKAVREEKHLHERGGAEWDRYAARVGAVVPRLHRARTAAGDIERHFAWRRVVRHREWKTWLGAVTVVACHWLRAR